MKEFLSDYLMKEINKINIPEESLNDAIEKAISAGRKKRFNLGKKMIYGCGAVVILFGMLIGSAFVSPVMAEVVSKIPYFGKLVESKSIGSVIFEELQEKGYRVEGVGASFQGKKKINIRLEGPESYYNQVKDEVEKTVKDVLKSRKYDAYSVKVNKSQEFVDTDKKETEMVLRLSDSITQELEKHHYAYLFLGFSEETITIELPNSVSDEDVQEIKQLINDIVKANHAGPYSIKVKMVDLEKREQGIRWAEILNAVGEDLLGKKEYKVTGLAYSVDPGPELVIKTSLKNGDADAKEFAENLEAVIEEFLKTEKLVSTADNDSYTITILNKKGKKIN
jgi:hypothetical protein